MDPKYYLGAIGLPEREVSKEEFIRAEQAAGFRSKFGPHQVATGGFSGAGMSGRVVYVPAEAKEDAGEEDQRRSDHTFYTHADTESLQRAWQAGYDTAWYAKNPAEKRTSVNPADAGELERLQRRIQNADLALKVQTQNCDTLRTQLAERDDLLREAARYATRMEPMPAKLLNRIDDTLSSSAEPSAPLKKE